MEDGYKLCKWGGRDRKKTTVIFTKGIILNKQMAVRIGKGRLNSGDDWESKWNVHNE